jgi:hypothetical protein
MWPVRVFGDTEIDEEEVGIFKIFKTGTKTDG